MSSNDPNSYSDAAQAVIKHIDFKFRVDFSEQTILVTAKYTLESAVSGSLFLDTRDLQISRI